MFEKGRRLLGLAALCLGLQGCMTALSVADFAASTVVTAGTLAVKGTGAVVKAMIPDGDEVQKTAESQAASAAN